MRYDESFQMSVNQCVESAVIIIKKSWMPDSAFFLHNSGENFYPFYSVQNTGLIHYRKAVQIFARLNSKFMQFFKLFTHLTTLLRSKVVTHVVLFGIR